MAESLQKIIKTHQFKVKYFWESTQKINREINIYRHIISYKKLRIKCHIVAIKLKASPHRKWKYWGITDITIEKIFCKIICMVSLH
jgi:hypothetical protein